MAYVHSVVNRDCNEREREIVRVWRAGHIGEGSIQTYLQWVRRFRSYCLQRRLNEEDQLTLHGVRQFAISYVGPRVNQLGVSSRQTARNALHAWASGLRALGAAVPEWRPTRVPLKLPQLLIEYCQFRCCHRGVAEATLHRDVKIAQEFLFSLQCRGKSPGKATVPDVDAFVRQASKRVSKRTLATTCGSLRAFLQFLRITGRLNRDLAAWVMSPRIRQAGNTRDGVLFVEMFKGRARWVPFHRSLARELEKYLVERRAFAPSRPNDFFFVSVNRQTLPVGTAEETLRKLFQQAGLKPARGRVGPRPYDFRHTFAVHRLSQWYRQGVDLHARLPWLSAYMGHDDILGTETYLTATPELLQLAGNRLRRRYLKANEDEDTKP